MLKMNEPTWTTREGKVIPLSEMSDTHLKNTIAMVERNQPELKEWRENKAVAFPLLMDEGQGTSEDFLEEMEYLEFIKEREFQHKYPMYAALLEEAERRNLDEKNQR